MTKEDKQLLLKDLCARLPYGVKLLRESWVYEWDQEMPAIEVLEDIDKDGYINNTKVYNIEDVKPYLRPMSSMTEEEKKEYHNLCFEEEREVFEYGEWVTKVYYHDTIESFDWLNKKMFDYRGLIPKGRAISTEKFNPYREEFN